MVGFRASPSATVFAYERFFLSRWTTEGEHGGQ